MGGIGFGEASNGGIAQEIHEEAADADLSADVHENADRSQNQVAILPGAALFLVGKGGFVFLHIRRFQDCKDDGKNREGKRQKKIWEANRVGFGIDGGVRCR
ncbi:Uncharacterised protein [Brucella melitensis]|nr:Uncharacterised protein [Brucella melitensis]